jgi:hypothetical protein
MLMRRALIPVLLVAALVAGCGSASGSGSSGSGGSPGSAAGILAAAQSAAKGATAASFDATVGLKVTGNLKGAGSGAAMLQGPIKLELKGEAGKASDGKPKFDVHFALNVTGGSFSGEALSPDGKTLYVQLPAILGAGWRSVPMSSASSAGGSAGTGSNGSLAKLKAAGLDPRTWLKNESVQSSGGQDTISADLNLPAVFADIAKVSTTPITAKERTQMRQLEQAVTTAHGSLSFDSSTHLPSDEAIQFAMTVPKALAKQAAGLKSLSVDFDVKFSNWNKDFSVSRPSGAKPLNTAGLLGGLGATGA